MTAKNVQPWRTSPTSRPNVFVSPAPIKNIASSWKKSVSGVGFSFGAAEFAARNPPPFTPSCLMISCEAIGPPVIV
jgi:hypothetical protein